jgi:hypothetical protein
MTDKKELFLRDSPVCVCYLMDSGCKGRQVINASTLLSPMFTFFFFSHYSEIHLS